MDNRNTYDDYSLSRVPKEAKQPVWQVTVVRLGAFACISQLMVGATLGYGMTFNSALISVLLGSVLLQVVGFAVGVIAAREGLSTSLLAKWAGFGNLGSALIGLILSIAMVGWFGVQNTVFADGMYMATGVLTPQIWALITGVSIIAIVVYGFKMLSWTANIALPLFIIAVGIAAVKMLSGNSISTLMSSPAPGPALSIAVGTSMVAGGFIIGAVITPDICRFLSKGKQVFWMVLISTFVGELGICLLAVLMAHAVKSSDIMTIMLSLSGWLGIAIVIFSTIKINDINLYSSSLGTTTALNAFFKKKFSRGLITVVIGSIGTILSMVGIINYFIGFLIFLGIAIPPIAGIIVIDYFVLKRDRAILDETQKTGELPSSYEKWNPIAITAWVGSFLVGYLVKAGIPAINSLLTAIIAYYILMKVVAAVQKKSIVEFERTKQVS